MNYQSVNLIASSLKISKDKSILDLSLNDYYKKILNDDFGAFMARFHRGFNSLIKNNKPDSRIEIRTPNFEIKYIVKSDKSSIFEINLLKRYERTFDSDFLESKLNPIKINGYVYFLNSDFGIKIGCTSNLTKRLKLFVVKLPFETSIHSFVKCTDYSKLESLLHTHLKHKRINGEWFNLTEDDFKEIDVILSNMGLKRENNG